jgi:hypothetical protein
MNVKSDREEGIRLLRLILGGKGVVKAGAFGAEWPKDNGGVTLREQTGFV